MEYWELAHERGHIELYTGTNSELREIDADFPEDEGKHRLLVRVDGKTRWRGRKVGGADITLSKFFTAPEPGKYGGAYEYNNPLLKIHSDVFGRFITGAEVHTRDGHTSFPIPAGSRGQQRVDAMKRSRFKGWLYPFVDSLSLESMMLFFFFAVPLIYGIVNFGLSVAGREPEGLVAKLLFSLVCCVIAVGLARRRRKQIGISQAA